MMIRMDLLHRLHPQPNTASSILLTVAFLLALTLTVGCGPDRPETLPVSGRVTVDGKPLERGKVVFYPEEGRSSIGAIGTDGSYTLTTFETGDGALPGKHRVTIRSTRVTQPANLPKSFEEELGTRADGPSMMDGKATLESLVPGRYSRRKTTPLTAEVAPGKETFDFSLKSD